MDYQSVIKLIDQCRVGMCVNMILNDRSEVQTLHINEEGAEVNFHNTPLVIVGISSDSIALVPIHSNLPVEVFLKVFVRSKCLFDVLNRDYYVAHYPKRWRQIEKHYPEVAWKK